MIWTAWNNGSHYDTGAGYGFKIGIEDRDQYFDQNWKSVVVILPAQPQNTRVRVNTKKASFWNDTCRELISKKIGRWLIDTNHAPWTANDPPKFEAQFFGNRQFRVVRVI